jgi:uncharacterized Rossmann fold enzyme
MMEPVVDLVEWWPWYERIITMFKYDIREDQRAAVILSDLITKSAISPSFMEKFITDKPVLVFGAGPSLEQNLYELEKEEILNRFSIISADGATTALLKITALTPQVIISDLDGNIRDLIQANKLGSIMVIHGHGDNILKLKKYVPQLKNIIGTTQAKPTPNVFNFGGFTDGDRAAFIAASMKPRVLVLAGMDIGKNIGEYSKKKIKSYNEKIMKLKVCKDLLEWLATKVNFPLYNVTEHGENIDKFMNVRASELVEMVDF